MKNILVALVVSLFAFSAFAETGAVPVAASSDMATAPHSTVVKKAKKKKKAKKAKKGKKSSQNAAPATPAESAPPAQ